MLDIICASILETLTIACASFSLECRSARDSSACCRTCCMPCSLCCPSYFNSQEGQLRLEEEEGIDQDAPHQTTITTEQPRWSAGKALRDWK